MRTDGIVGVFVVVVVAEMIVIVVTWLMMTVCAKCNIEPVQKIVV